MAASKKSDEVSVLKLETGTVLAAVVGTTPLICNRMSQKTIFELLLPKGRKNAAEKASTLKHDPLEEFRQSPYTLDDESQPTLIAMLSTAFKGAIRSAALDMPGASKAQLGRLTFVPGMYTPVYGIPQIMSSIVRSADINRTPDVRTRAVIREWAAIVSITYVQPALKEQSVLNLLASAGVTIGVGDWRPEKGKGDFGQFRIAGSNDEQFQRIVADGGRAAQIEAMKDPVAFDNETEELLSWYETEVKRRGFKVVKEAA